MNLDFGLLSKNARNLLYIKRYNPKKTIRLADNKFKTKQFLEERGIPVPRTYALIRSRWELQKFDFDILPENFVVKPNRWSKWRGILIVKKLRDEEVNLVERPFWWFSLSGFFKWQSSLEENKFYFKVWDRILDQKSFKRQLVDILDGKYSISPRDEILIEEKLKPSETFQDFCKYWLADIRVITFNLVPVAAMVRMPTPDSGGKANLAQWALGLGVDLSSWEIKTLFFKWELFVDKFPSDYAHLKGKKIPYWDDVLLFSSKIQYFVNLGYLALDWVITPNGPKLLEMNARAGLEIQNVALVPLKARLQKLKDLDIEEPLKWIEIAKSLFSPQKTFPVTGILYLSQNWELQIQKGDEFLSKNVIVNVNLNKQKNYISPALKEIVEDANNITLYLPDSGITIKSPSLEVDPALSNSEIVIGRSLAQEYLIKPLKKAYDLFSIVSKSKVQEGEIDSLQTLDQKLYILSRKLNPLKYIRPINFWDEFDNFVTWRGNYNPSFKYKWPSEDSLKSREKELLYLQEKYFTPGSWLGSEFAKIFEDKIQELLDLTYLLRAYKRQKFDDILNYNIRLFGELDKDLVIYGKKKTLELQDSAIEQALGKLLSISQVKAKVASYLKKLGIENWKIEIHPSLASRIMVSRRGDSLVVKLSLEAKIYEYELESVLAHELDVHAKRYLEWLKSGWKILQSGTAHYIREEEGLALYFANQKLPSGFEKPNIYLKYRAFDIAQTTPFVRLVDFYKSLYPDADMLKVFKRAIRFKRGVENTGVVHPWAIFLKDKVYLEGYETIKKYVEEWFDLNQLFVGKIKRDDLQYIR